MSAPQRESAAESRPVFWVAITLALLFVGWSALSPEALASVASTTVSAVSQDFGWFYLLATAFFVVFMVVLALGRHAHVRLGRDDEKPEFSRLSWCSMLFAAGMGIGLVFFGVAEPVSHFSSPPYGEAQAGTPEAAALGMRYTFFHWGVHLWAIYAVVALAIAYFQFRRGHGGLISSTFRGVLGDRVDGTTGTVIDVLGVLSTVFGVAVSLGLGALQINGGLNHLFGVPVNAGVQVGVIAVITVVFLLSALAGLRRGILRLSRLNMVLAVVLLALVFVLGATVASLDILAQTLGDYAAHIVPMSLDQAAFQPGASTWADDWTLFYWANAIAWSPFVGTFIARISRGRTIREFVVGVLLVPSVVSFVWFAVFGATALQAERDSGGITNAVESDVSTAMFAVFDQLPLGAVMSVVAIALVSIFFVTSADSGTFVLGSLSTGGTLEPGVRVKMVWGIAISSFASVMLLAGGLEALQNVPIAIAAPFAVLMVGMCWSVHAALREENPPARAARRAAPDAGPVEEPAPAGAVVSGGGPRGLRH